MAKEILGEDNISVLKPLMGSEDFSFYLQKIPGTFAFLGVENKDKGIIYPHHHPKFNIDEDILPIGTALHVAVALEYLKGGRGNDKFFLTSFLNWDRIFVSYRRDPNSSKGRGAEGANSDEIGTKLSGKRTVTYLNPGKIALTF